MDLQTRKLNVIEYLIQLNDDEKITEIEKIIFSYKKNRKDTARFSEEEIIFRAELSEKQYKNGEIIDQDQLSDESKDW